MLVIESRRDERFVYFFGNECRSLLYWLNYHFPRFDRSETDIVGDVVTKKAKTKHMLEEQIRDIAPIEFEEETDEKI